MVCVDKTNKLVSRGFEDLSSMKCLWAGIFNFGISNHHIISINKQHRHSLEDKISSIQTYKLTLAFIYLFIYLLKWIMNM